MPIYEYQFKKEPKTEFKGCEYCREPFEVLVLKKEEEPTHCEKCQSPLEKIISKKYSFVLKGDGWYSPGHSGPKK